MAVDLSNIYHTHMTQRVPKDPHWTVNCTAYCAAMLINDSVLGGLTGITGARIRAMSDEPTPDSGSPGLNIQQIVNVARKLRVPIYDKSGESWATLKGRVGSGASRALVQIYYDALDPYGCQSAGTFGHAAVLVAFDGSRVRMSDPLCTVTRWYPESAVRHAAEVFAKQTGMSGIRYAVTRVVPKKA